MEEIAPWTAFKKGTVEEKEAASEALVAVIEAVRIVAVLLLPVTPGLSRRIYEQLGFTDDQWLGVEWKNSSWGALERGSVMSKPSPVFVRFDGDMITE